MSFILLNLSAIKSIVAALAKSIVYLSLCKLSSTDSW